MMQEKPRIVDSDSLSAAYLATEKLRKTGYAFVYNKANGLMVFNKAGHLKFPQRTRYWNPDQRNKTIYYQDKYTVRGRHYSKYQLICYCMVFGTYDPLTEDYMLVSHDFKWDIGKHAAEEKSK